MSVFSAVEPASIEELLAGWPEPDVAYSTTTPIKTELPHVLDALRNKTLGKTLNYLTGIKPEDLTGGVYQISAKGMLDVLIDAQYAASKATEQDAIVRLYKALGTDMGWDLSGLVPPDQTAGQLAARLAATPDLVAKRVAAGASPTEALAQSVNFITSLAGSLVHDTSRQGAATIGKVHPAFRGWVWIPEPGACSWCRMQATRGAVFHSNVRHSHRHCRCYLGEVVNQPVADSLKQIGASEWHRMVENGTAPHKPWPHADLHDPKVRAGAVTPERLAAVEVQIKTFEHALSQINVPDETPSVQWLVKRLNGLYLERAKLQQALSPAKAAVVRKMRPAASHAQQVDLAMRAKVTEGLGGHFGLAPSEKAKREVAEKVAAELRLTPGYDSRTFAHKMLDTMWQSNNIDAHGNPYNLIDEMHNPDAIFEHFQGGYWGDPQWKLITRRGYTDWDQTLELTKKYPERIALGGSTAVLGDLERTAVARGINQWAMTSADNEPLSLAFQYVARDHFGLSSNAWLRKPRAVQSKIATLLADGGDRQFAAFLDAQYNVTQRWLRDQGIDEVHLLRGLSLSPTQRANLGLVPGEVTGVAQQPLSSWTYDPAIASAFTTGATGTMIEAIIPREMIFSTPRSGFGCLGEAEFVVLADEGEVLVWGW